MRAVRAVRRVLLAIVLVYAGVLVAMMSLENSLVFFPAKYPAGNWEPTDLPLENVAFAAADGTKLHGWYVESPANRGTLLFAHGNAGNLTGRVDKLQAFRDQLGLNLFLFDYRGYGKSEGSPSETGVIADANAALDWLTKTKELREADVILYGESIGGGVMVDLASRRPCRALILESTFTSLPDVAATVFPWIPVRWMMRNRLDSAAKIGQIRSPLLQLHGEADSVIPYRIGRQLFDRANEPKEFVSLQTHDHNDPLPTEWINRMELFLNRWPAPQEK